MKGLNRHVDVRERACLQGQTVLVNSPVLAEKYQSIADHIHEVRTTTLSEESFFEREDTCGGPSINILYTGRFEWAKGLQELIDAFCVLVVEKGIDAKLHYVGWQDSRGPSIEKAIIRQAEERGISDRILFHGKKKVGPDLDAMYRMADIYVLPSYAEGFPRTIWEAMANSLPVIATKVGAIPEFLQQEKHALLIPPRDTDALVVALLNVLDNRRMRCRLIREGRDLACTHTLERQSENLVGILQEVFDRATNQA